MQKTRLVYLDDSHKMENDAKFLSLEQIDGKGIAVVLDQTIFYPQGGGQPADQGQISSPNATFNVNDVRFVDGVVHHYGTFSNGEFAGDESVMLRINPDRRLLHTKLHSAGHLIDATVRLLELPLTPTKGYHFSDGPYVEYDGEIPVDQREDIRLRLEQKVNELMNSKLETQVVYATQAQMQEICGFIPNYIINDKEIRVVTLVPKLGCPCGGTHVKNSQDIGHITLTKIRIKGGQSRICYKLI
jgi:Ser-tRNA(Ala) deacylase AlaX